MLLLSVLGFVGVAAFGAGNVLLVLARSRPATVPAPLGGEGTWIPPAASGSVEARRSRRRRRLAARVLRRPSAGLVLYLTCLVLYAGVGAYLVIHSGSIVGDAQARVADGYYIFFSRDPHVAAVGFVWNPLPSLADTPFFLLKGVLPAVIERSYAGSLMSAFFMAGAVVQVRGAVREAGGSVILGRILVAAFALNPMVIYYGANGMSEAPYVFFLALSVRYLARWTATGSLTALVWAGLAMGGCYLARYEAAVAAIGGCLVVLAVSWLRTRGPGRHRLAIAASDVAVFVVPFSVAFVGWALTSKVIMGSAFEYITSQYGNTSQVETVGVENLPGHGTGIALPVFVGLQLLSFAPALPLLAVAGLLHARRSRDLRILVPLLTLGAVSAFIFLTFVSGTTFGWLRLHLPVAVMGTLCIAYLFAPARPSIPDAAEPVESAASSTARTPRARPVAKKAGAGVLLGSLLALAAVPTTAWAMFDHRLGVGEVPQLSWVLHPGSMTEGDRNTKAIASSAETIARRIDALHLAPGSVVTDTFTPCVSAMLMNSAHPHQFVITSDRDFQRTLADPVTFRAQYLLLPPPNGYGALDAVTRAYPNLYVRGAEGARLVTTFHEPGCPELRLYRVLPPKRRS